MRIVALILPLALLACSGKDGRNPSDSGPTTGGTTGTPTGTTPAGPATGTTPTTAPPPVANTDTIVVDEGTGSAINPLANDTSDVGISPLSLTLTSYPSHGTLEISAGGVGYTHNGSESLTDSFSYTVTDILGQVSNEGLIAVTINPVNDPPLAVDDQATVDEGDTTTFDVVGNDLDPDDTIDPSTLVIVGPPSAGTATANPDGSVEYTQDGSDVAVDAFTYTVMDASGATSNNGAVQITIIDVNDTPTAGDDAMIVNPGTTEVVRVLANDDDPDDGLDPNSITIVTQPTKGTAVVDPVNAEIEYTHAGGGVVPDTDFLTYTVSDYSGAVSNTATVNITIDYYTPPVYVGSYQVFTGPDVFTNPPVYTCKEACAQVYGGVEADYSCSTSAGSVDNMAKASTWGQYGCITVAEDFSEDQGAGYDCGAPGCSTSAYVLDQCFYGGTNHCWQ